LTDSSIVQYCIKLYYLCIYAKSLRENKGALDEQGAGAENGNNFHDYPESGIDEYFVLICPEKSCARGRPTYPGPKTQTVLLRSLFDAMYSGLQMKNCDLPMGCQGAKIYRKGPVAPVLSCIPDPVPECICGAVPNKTLQD